MAISVSSGRIPLTFATFGEIQNRSKNNHQRLIDHADIDFGAKITFFFWEGGGPVNLGSS